MDDVTYERIRDAWRAAGVRLDARSYTIAEDAVDGHSISAERRAAWRTAVTEYKAASDALNAAMDARCSNSRTLEANGMHLVDGHTVTR